MRALITASIVCLLVVPVHAQYGGGSGTTNDPYQIWTAEQMNAIGAEPNDYDKHFKLMADVDLSDYDGKEGRPAFRIIGAGRYEPLRRRGSFRLEGTPFTGVFDGDGHAVSHLTVVGKGFLGLFGLVESPAEIRDLAIVDVNVIGSADYVGGLVGSNGFRWSSAGGLIADCSVSGAVVGEDGGVGGLVGANEGSITDCYSTGSVSGDGYVGGLIGDNSRGHVTRCYSAASVTGQTDVGGLAGSNGWEYSGGTISNSYSSGTVTGQYGIGGLLGSDSGGLVIRCYSTASVSGADGVGGLVGGGECDVIASFWDTEISGLETSEGGTGLTTAQMRDMQTYQDAGWDFAGQMADGLHEIWWMPEGGGYPALAHFSGYQRPQLEGLGTMEQPYLISDAHDLGAMVYYSSLAHYRLTASIDLSGVRWPVAVIPWFGGRFDGNGLQISHLTVVGAGELGLFGKVESDAQVTNLAVVDVNIIGSDAAVGGLAGGNRGAVTGCCSTGVVSGIDFVGGLIGEDFYTGLVTNCYSSVAASGGRRVGGLIGYSSGEVVDSFSTGNVNGTYSVGGLIGAVQHGTVIRCYATGPVSGDQNVGGLVGGGWWYSSSILHAVWDVETSGLPGSAGGVGLTTTEMMDPHMLGLNGFAGDPNWVLDEGRDYPRLAWEGTPGEVIPEPSIDWLAGQGTEETPYRIDTADQLILLRRASVLWDRHLTLGADIDLDPNLSGRKEFVQAVIPAFTGIFDGGRHTILNLTISGVSYLGLFGQIGSGGQVSNVGIVGARIAGSGMDIGALAGANYQGTVTRCYSTGSVSGEHDGIGGLVGRVETGDVCQCYSTAAVSGGRDTGGLVGDLSYGSITDCYSRGPVNSGDSSGGLLGGGDYPVVSRCYSTGAVSGGALAGGLVGCGLGYPVFVSFYDIQTAGKEYSCGLATGLTTAEMQTVSTFLEAGWDFVDETDNGTENIWWIDEGQDYPRLWWEPRIR